MHAESGNAAASGSAAIVLLLTIEKSIETAGSTKYFLMITINCTLPKTLYNNNNILYITKSFCNQKENILLKIMRQIRKCVYWHFKQNICDNNWKKMSTLIASHWWTCVYTQLFWFCMYAHGMNNVCVCACLNFFIKRHWGGCTKANRLCTLQMQLYSVGAIALIFPKA